MRCRQYGRVCVFAQFICTFGVYMQKYSSMTTGMPTDKTAKLFQQGHEQSLAWYALHESKHLRQIGDAALNWYKSILQNWAGGDYVS
jgi:hypothetical protein